ncbi:hypothetical protein AGMMS49574_04840 [Bacteroidia bacterium]|nr:hypothetical protein AGMMS49574_04840 [Bacteroidia bacterium]
MRTLLYIITCFILVIAPNMQAQAPAQKNVTAKVNRSDLRGNSLNLDVDVRLNYLDVGRYESLKLTLVLRDNATKKQIVRLPAIIVNGTNKRQMYDRAVEILGKEAAKGKNYAVLKCDKGVIQFVPYRRTIAFKPWMNNCQLVIIGEVKDYNDKTVSGFTNVIQQRLPVTRR